MNLQTLEQELALIIQDSSLTPYFRDWLNDAVSEIASDFHLPGLKIVQPWPLSVNQDQWLYDLPENYMKHLFRVRRGVEKEPVVILRDISELDMLDMSHSDIGETVSRVAVTDRKIGVWPKAEDTLYLWYYRKPVPMENAQDEPDGIPAPYRSRVLLPKVVIKNFKLIQDLMNQPPHQSLAWWQEEYRSGLFGSPRGDIGMINHFTREKGPRRQGGRDPLP